MHNELIQYLIEQTLFSVQLLVWRNFNWFQNIIDLNLEPEKPQTIHCFPNS